MEVSTALVCLDHSNLTAIHVRFHRTMTRPYFTRDRISHFEMFDRHAGMRLSPTWFAAVEA